MQTLAYQVNVQPFKDKANNVLSIINEMVLWAISLVMIVFTTDIKDRDTIDYSGWAMISLFIINVFINLIIVLIQSIKIKARKCLRNSQAFSQNSDNNKDSNRYIDVTNFGRSTPIKSLKVSLLYLKSINSCK